jgi:aspartyl-tRNA(Asn)/glutamyl-tRNA(Gln) amidotransferase subunit C
MRIDDQLIRYLEDLSCLTLSDAEKTRLRGDLDDILNGMAQLGTLDTAGVRERSHPFDHVNAFREDVAIASFDREGILQNAPDRSEDMFIAPKTVE